MIKVPQPLSGTTQACSAGNVHHSELGLLQVDGLPGKAMSMALRRLVAHDVTLELIRRREVVSSQPGAKQVQEEHKCDVFCLLPQ